MLTVERENVLYFTRNPHIFISHFHYQYFFFREIQFVEKYASFISFLFRQISPAVLLYSGK